MIQYIDMKNEHSTEEEIPKFDARKKPHLLEEKRREVIRLYKLGWKRKDIGTATNLSQPTIRKAIEFYEKYGLEGLKPKKRGRPTGAGRMLTKEQEKQVQKVIRDKRPEQLKMPFALWTRGVIRLYILEEFGIDLALSTISVYLKRWGYTPQKPILRAYEQDPKAVEKWLNEEYRAIATRAKAEGAEIHWADETAVVNTDVRGRSYAPKGQTPIAYRVGGTREKFSMISSVNNKGSCFWMIYEGALTGKTLIEFMVGLHHDVGRKVFLIMDNLSVHHCRPVKEWLEANRDKVEAFYLPSYSPELNPDERLNADLKHALTTTAPCRTKARLLERTKEHMQMISNSPERVKKYFKDENVAYAAE